LKVKSLDQAIKFVLFRDGHCTTLELHRRVLKKYSSTEKTFLKHLGDLTEKKEIDKKPEGQYHVYSLSTAKRSIVEQTSKILDDMINDSKMEYQKYLKSLKKFTRSNYSKGTAQQRFQIFDYGLVLIQIILNQSQLTTFLINTQYPSIAMKKKAREIQSMNEEHLKEIFGRLKKIDPTLQSMVFRSLFAELFN